jgi:hypothetical protein
VTDLLDGATVATGALIGNNDAVRGAVSFTRTGESDFNHFSVLLLFK